MAIAVAVPMICLLLLAAAHDVAFRIIPNAIPAYLGLLGLAWRGYLGANAIETTLLVALALAILLALVHWRGWLGGGDVKLAVATALGLPPFDIYRFVVLTATAGGVLAMLYLVARLLPRVGRAPQGSSRWLRLCVIERWRMRRRGTLPYGVALAGGGAIVLVQLMGH